MEETWHKIPFTRNYEISTLGIVRYSTFNKKEYRTPKLYKQAGRLYININVDTDTYSEEDIEEYRKDLNASYITYNSDLLYALDHHFEKNILFVEISRLMGYVFFDGYTKDTKCVYLDKDKTNNALDNLVFKTNKNKVVTVYQDEEFKITRDKNGLHIWPVSSSISNRVILHTLPEENTTDKPETSQN